MLVTELIEKLQQYHPDTNVKVWSPFSDLAEPAFQELTADASDYFDTDKELKIGEKFLVL